MNPLISQVQNELADVLKLYKNTPSNPATLTIKGRTYEISNVEEMKDGTWQVTNDISKGMFMCDLCPDDQKDQPGDQWLQFKHNGNVVRMHSSTIHLFKKHPENIPEEDLKTTAAVFID